MKNVKDQVFKALLGVTSNVSDVYPTGWSEDVSIQLTEEENVVYERTDNREQKARVNKELTRIALMNIAAEKAGNVIAYFNDIASGRAQISKGAWEGLMAAIETLYPDFLETVQSRESKPLHEPLLHTICLLKIGMKPAQIAKVMDAKIQTVWNRVKRAEEICGDMLDTVSAKE